jgi:hypothetical protein
MSGSRTREPTMIFMIMAFPSLSELIIHPGRQAGRKKGYIPSCFYPRSERPAMLTGLRYFMPANKFGMTISCEDIPQARCEQRNTCNLLFIYGIFCCSINL